MTETDPIGLLGIGGDLSVKRLILAYQNGIFPWSDPGDPVHWWSPDPRFVLYPDNLHISKSTRPLLRKQLFRVTLNQDFPAVIRACKEIYRPGQGGTWISDELEASYTKLHRLGIAHSVEVWQEGKLVGGLFGELFGRVFFGESMFSKVSGASKFGFITLVRNMTRYGIRLIDCQIHSPYLESMGATHIERKRFINELKAWQQEAFPFEEMNRNLRQDADFLLA